MATQAAIQVMANDEAVASCASLGNFELNAFLPLLADRLLDSLKILDAAVDLLTTRCIDPLEADIAGCRSHLSHALILATVLSPYIGYEKASELAKTCGNDREKYCRLDLEEVLMTKEALTRVLRAHHLEDLASQL